MIILLAVTIPLAIAGAILFAYGAFLAFRHGLGGSPGDVTVPEPQYGFSVQYRPGGPGRRSMSWSQIRAAVRERRWRTDPAVRAFLAMIAGAMALVAGLFFSVAAATSDWEMLVIVAIVFAVLGYSAATR